MSSHVIGWAVMSMAVLSAPGFLILAIRRTWKNARFSRTTRIFSISLLGLLMLPYLAFIAAIFWITVLDFPFTSGVIADATAPTGEEVCVIQISDVFEYQVSLYAHRAGQPWVWHYLENDDDRWRNCRLGFSGDELRVYTGSTLRKTIPVSQLTTKEVNDSREFPADYTPAQILADRK